MPDNLQTDIALPGLFKFDKKGVHKKRSELLLRVPGRERPSHDHGDRSIENQHYGISRYVVESDAERAPGPRISARTEVKTIVRQRSFPTLDLTHRRGQADWREEVMKLLG